jgi:hypothetical protein
MLTTKIRTTIVALVAFAALTTTGVASAANRTTHRTHKQSTHARTLSRTVSRSGTPIVKPVVTGNTVAAIKAFPAGGKGSGTEATCELWSGKLNEDQGAVDAAVHNNDLEQYNETKGALDEDVDNALDAGCAVIY